MVCILSKAKPNHNIVTFVIVKLLVAPTLRYFMPSQHDLSILPEGKWFLYIRFHSIPVLWHGLRVNTRVVESRLGILKGDAYMENIKRVNSDNHWHYIDMNASQRRDYYIPAITPLTFHDYG